MTHAIRLSLETRSLQIYSSGSSHLRTEIRKADGKDEIWPDILRTLNEEGVRWLTKVWQVAWKLGKTSKDWQTGVIISIYEKGVSKECTNYRDTVYHFLAFQERCMPSASKGNADKIVESKLEDG